MRAIAHNNKINQNNEESVEVYINNDETTHTPHMILGHAGKEIIKKHGMEHNSHTHSHCDFCNIQNIKSHKAYRHSPGKYAVDIPMHKVSGDLSFVQNGKGKPYGKVSPMMLVLVDHYTNFRYVEFPRSKKETGAHLAKFINLIKNFFQMNIKYLHTDKGTEFLGGESKEVLIQNGIRLSTTSGYSSKSNGKVEKLNQDIMRRVKANLASSGLTLDFWTDAASYVVEIMNRTPEKRLENVSPLYYLMKCIGAEAEVIDIPPYPFGHLVTMKLPPINGKLSPRGTHAVYLGISNQVLGGYVVWYPKKKYHDQLVDTNEPFIRHYGEINHTKDIIFSHKKTSFMEWFQEEYRSQRKIDYNDIISEAIDFPVEEIEENTTAIADSTYKNIEKPIINTENKNDIITSNKEPLQINVNNYFPSNGNFIKSVPDIAQRNQNALPLDFNKSFNFDHQSSIIDPDRNSTMIAKAINQINPIENTSFNEYFLPHNEHNLNNLGGGDIENGGDLKNGGDNNTGVNDTNYESEINKIEKLINEKLKSFENEIDQRINDINDIKDNLSETENTKIIEENMKDLDSKFSSEIQKLENNLQISLENYKSSLEEKLVKYQDDNNTRISPAVQEFINNLQENARMDLNNIYEKQQEQFHNVQKDLKSNYKKLKDTIKKSQVHLTIDQKRRVKTDLQKLKEDMYQSLRQNNEGMINEYNSLYESIDNKIKNIDSHINEIDKKVIDNNESINDRILNYMDYLNKLNVYRRTQDQSMFKYQFGKIQEDQKLIMQKINDATNSNYNNDEYMRGLQLQLQQLNKLQAEYDEIKQPYIQYPEKKMILDKDVINDEDNDDSSNNPKLLMDTSYHSDADENEKRETHNNTNQENILTDEENNSLTITEKVQQKKRDIDNAVEKYNPRTKNLIDGNINSKNIISASQRTLRSGPNIKSVYRKNANDYFKHNHNISFKINQLSIKELKELNEVKLTTTNVLLVPDITLDDNDVRFNLLHLNNVKIKEALSSEEKENWIKAMEKEYMNLMKHKTWQTEAVEIKNGYQRQRVVRTMWVLTQKRDGTYKARLVARGDTQPEYTYGNTYASTLSYEYLRIIIAEAAERGFNIEFMDISNAYVNADIDTTIYIQLPENTPFINVKNYKEGKMYAHKLTKSLYGLKQSGRNWQLLLEDVLEDLELEKWSDVESVMRLRENGEVVAIVGYFVDDLIIAGKENKVNKIMNGIKKRFKCTITPYEDNNTRNILGIDVNIKKDGSITLSQESYIEKLGIKFNINSSKRSTALDPHFVFIPWKIELNMNVSELNNRIKELRKIIGALLFVAMGTRPDILFAVVYLARYVLIPHESIMNQAYKIVRYLLHTKNRKIRYEYGTKKDFIGFSDADWSNDKADFISMKASLFMYAGGPIAWRCKKGKVCQSSAESELLSYIQTCNMTCKLRRIFSFLYGFNSEEWLELPTDIFCDNNSQISMTKSGNTSQNTVYLGQQVAVAYQYLMDNIAKPKKIDTEYELADILTKPVEAKVMNNIAEYIFRY